MYGYIRRTFGKEEAEYYEQLLTVQRKVEGGIHIDDVLDSVPRKSILGKRIRSKLLIVYDDLGRLGMDDRNIPKSWADEDHEREDWGPRDEEAVNQ